MTYEPLPHKYRPQTFADLVGQEAIATTLTSAIHTRRIAPAYLFTGPRGTGKTSSARILAKSLNCLQSDVPTAQPCGVCHVCVGITKGSTLDVIEIDAASNTGVDNIREIIERAQFAPVQCRHKVYIIDEVHMLSTAAFNALLKTLEEPPHQVVFVLATTDPQRVLPTIISRCQRFDFRRIPLDAMVDHLRKIAQLENIEITAEAVRLVGQVAQGGLRDAESLLDQLSLLSGQVTVERVWDLVGAVPERDLMALTEAIASDHPEAVLDKVRQLMDRGREPLIVLQNLAGFYRDLLIAKTAPNRPDLVAVTAPTWKALCEFEGLDKAIILQAQKQLKESEVQIKNTTQPRLWLEVTLMGLLPSAVQSPVSEVRNQPSRNNHQLQSPKTTPSSVSSSDNSAANVSPQLTPPPEPSPVQPENPQPSPTEPQSAESKEAQNLDLGQQSQLEQIWQQLLANLPLGTQALLRQHCHLCSFDENVALIGISTQPLLDIASGRLSNIEAALEKVFKRKVKVSFKVVGAKESKSAVSEEPRSFGQTSPPSPPPEVKQESAANYQASNQSDALPAKSQIRMESPKANFTAQRTPTSAEQPPQPQALQVPQWDTDEVSMAAKRLAEFFKGEVVQLSQPELSPPVVSPSPSSIGMISSAEVQLEEELLDDDDDIPF